MNDVATRRHGREPLVLFHTPGLPEHTGIRSLTHLHVEPLSAAKQSTVTIKIWNFIRTSATQLRTAQFPVAAYASTP